MQNFENQNPANTLWTKQYNLYSKIDTEAPRYLEFERWWGGHVNLNAEEIQFIVDELFIGNNLAAGRIQTSDGATVDLRNIRSPIVVFCSKGDNITPPQQALGWILDLYAGRRRDPRLRADHRLHHPRERRPSRHFRLRRRGAKKEHGEFSSNIDLIDTLPPGLYEAVFEAKSERYRQSRACHRAIGSCAAKQERSTTFAHWAAMTPRMSGVSRPLSESRRSISRSIAHFMQPMVRALVIRTLGGVGAATASVAAAICRVR